MPEICHSRNCHFRTCHTRNLSFQEPVIQGICHIKSTSIQEPVMPEAHPACNISFLKHNVSKFCPARVSENSNQVLISRMRTLV